MKEKLCRRWNLKVVICVLGCLLLTWSYGADGLLIRGQELAKVAADAPIFAALGGSNTLGVKGMVGVSGYHASFASLLYSGLGVDRLGRLASDPIPTHLHVLPGDLS